jgi:hypothetical protein
MERQGILPIHRMGPSRKLHSKPPKKQNSSAVTETQPKKGVAIIGSRISGIASAATLERVGEFDITVFERRGVPGGSWVKYPLLTTKPQFTSAGFGTMNPLLMKPARTLPITVPRVGKQLLHSTPLYLRQRSNVPYKVLAEGSIFELPPPENPASPFLSGVEISAAVEKIAHQFDHLIDYHTTVENVEKLPGTNLRLTLRKENSNDTETVDRTGV